MHRLRIAQVTVAAAVAAVLYSTLAAPPPARSQAQAPDVLLNVIGQGAKKLNIFVPHFTVTAGADAGALARSIPEITGNDLRFSALFTVVSDAPAPPAGNPAALKEQWAQAASAGAHAALHGLLAMRPDKVEAEMRLYDLTSADQRLIVTKKFELPPAAARRLAHKIADEVVYQFTGELGIADTKIAHLGATAGAKEIFLMDYDGAGATKLTANQSIVLSPTWSPDGRSIAFTSYMGSGYPHMYRLFPFEKRTPQLLAGYLGINTTPAWSPDGKMLALTLSKDGNPRVYLLNVANGNLRRLTNHTGIDTEPTWSPTGREIAFTSDRSGPAHIFVMDAEGTNVRRLTSTGFNTQPRWSPKGDSIVFTSRQGNFDLWAVSPDGSNLRRLTADGGDNQGASWAPNGRHLAFQSNRTGRYQLYTMLADGSEAQPLTRGASETTSAAWSPRFP